VPVTRRITILFADDFDGSEAASTVRFALDGTEYEIDLNAEHAQALRDALARYVQAARRATSGARDRRRGWASGVDGTKVREWAKAQEIDVKDRGQIPPGLVVKFKDATMQYV
jgi:Lsr2